MGVNCLVVGHYDQSLEDLAARVMPTADVSGGYTEVRTNCIVADGVHLSYSDAFKQLSGGSSGMNVSFNPFDAPHSGAIYLVNRLRQVGVDAAALHYVSPDRHELTRALEAASPEVVVLTTTFYVHETPVTDLIDHVRRV